MLPEIDSYTANTFYLLLFYEHRIEPSLTNTETAGEVHLTSSIYSSNLYINKYILTCSGLQGPDKEKTGQVAIQSQE